MSSVIGSNFISSDGRFRYIVFDTSRRPGLGLLLLQISDLFDFDILTTEWGGIPVVVCKCTVKESKRITKYIPDTFNIVPGTMVSMTDREQLLPDISPDLVMCVVNSKPMGEDEILSGFIKQEIEIKNYLDGIK
jgi:hypothetical protein